jgi:hypothetical protein
MEEVLTAAETDPYAAGRQCGHRVAAWWIIMVVMVALIELQVRRAYLCRRSTAVILPHLGDRCAA